MPTTNFSSLILKGAGTRGIPEIPGGGGSSFTNTYSLDFDGIDDIITFSTITFDATSGLTLSCWIKYTAASAGGSLNWLCSNGGTGGTSSQFNYRLISDGRWFTYFQGSPRDTGINGLNDGNWHHIASTVNYSNGDVKFYKDGVESATIQTWGSTYSTAKLQVIGAATSAAVYPYGGFVDEFAVFESLLTPTEISTIATAPSDLSTYNPVAWYRFEEGSGTTAIDSGTGGNNGTISGATYSTDVPT